MDFVKTVELIINHGWIGFLLCVFTFLLFVFTIVNIHTTLLYKAFVFSIKRRNY